MNWWSMRRGPERETESGLLRGASLCKMTMAAPTPTNRNTRAQHGLTEIVFPTAAAPFAKAKNCGFSEMKLKSDCRKSC